MRAASLLMAAVWFAASAVQAAEIHIVAFGDSGVVGSGCGPTRLCSGVPMSRAFPALIERDLRARGWDVEVTNQGVRGDRASRALARVDSAVPQGTHLTLVMLGGNDLRAGASIEEVGANMRKIVAAILSKGSKVIIIRTVQPPSAQPNPYVRLWLAELYDPKTQYPMPGYDSGDLEHLNVAANELIAQRAVPDIEVILRAMGLKPSKPGSPAAASDQRGASRKSVFDTCRRFEGTWSSPGYSGTITLARARATWTLVGTGAPSWPREPTPVQSFKRTENAVEIVTRGGARFNLEESGRKLTGGVMSTAGITASVDLTCVK